MKFPLMPMKNPRKITVNSFRLPMIFARDLSEVKCLEDGTRQMAEDVLLVGSHVASWAKKITGKRP
jgi:hypothetical protein